jgi:GT2 family glycosyltransferase
MMELSLVIVNYNTAHCVGACLASIERHLADVPHEVCVVDNASVDDSVALLQREYRHVRLLCNERNLGFAAGINRAVHATTGRHVLWLNPDSALRDGGIVELLRFLNANPRVGIVGPRIVNADDSLQLSCRSFPSYRTALFHRYALLTRLFPGNRFSDQYLLTNWDHTSVRQVDWVSGACLLHRRQLWEELDGLDERFFMYCEDVDFCLRARQAGWQTWFHPGMCVRHDIAGSSRSGRVRATLVRHQSMWRYYRKHFGPNPVKDLAVGAAVGLRCGWLLAAGVARQGGRISGESGVHS